VTGSVVAAGTLSSGGTPRKALVYRRISSDGFTVLELTLVLVIVGLLAAIAIPQAGRARERAYVATMKSDLRNFAVAEESYFYDKAVYAGDVGLLHNRGYQTSRGVTLEVNEATAIGWAATASHGNTPIHCYLYAGGAAPVGTATRDGIISCQ
jgi:prepilin-type N-terminal cleavage/methylation domain-containing protein